MNFSDDVIGGFSHCKNSKFKSRPFIPQARGWKEKIKGIITHRVRRERQDAPVDIIVRKLDYVHIPRSFGTEVNFIRRELQQMLLQLLNYLVIQIVTMIYTIFNIKTFR